MAGVTGVTESEWLVCIEPEQLLSFLRQNDSLTQRKSRLFGAAACRRLWHLMTDNRSRKAVEAAERFAEGELSAEELYSAFDDAFTVGAALAALADEKQNAFLR